VTTPSGVQDDLGWALGTVMRAHLRTAQDIVGGLPGGPRGYQVLAAAAAGGSSSQLALAQRLGVDRTVMTYLLDELEGAGLVERNPDPTDRRVRRITLTDEGGARLCALERSLRAAEEHVLEPLDAAERATLRTLLLRVATRAGGGPQSACEIARELDGGPHAPVP
jgi:DNA-binding MarR family transcriptional regulator